MGDWLSSAAIRARGSNWTAGEAPAREASTSPIRTKLAVNRVDRGVFVEWLLSAPWSGLAIMPTTGWEHAAHGKVRCRPAYAKASTVLTSSELAPHSEVWAEQEIRFSWASPIEVTRRPAASEYVVPRLISHPGTSKLLKSTARRNSLALRNGRCFRRGWFDPLPCRSELARLKHPDFRERDGVRSAPPCRP